MITIIFYGLDQFVVGQLSQEMTAGLAKLYEVKEDDINFVARENMVYHNGCEQTSWNVLIHVHAPMKVSVLQDFVKDYIFRMVGELAIHKTLEFYYYSQDNRYEEINPNYKRYLEDSALNIDIDNGEYQEKEEGEGEDDIYTGDAFEGHQDELDSMEEPYEDEEDECDCEECTCHHHHH